METYCWLAAWLVAGSLCRPVSALQALDDDLKTAWLSFGDESALEVSVTQDALYISTSYLFYSASA